MLSTEAARARVAPTFVRMAPLADGTLTADRRSALQAALLSDPELRGIYESHRRLDALLREPPQVQVDLGELSDGIMAAVRQERPYGRAAPAPRTVKPAAESAALQLVRNWWVTISAAAAALVVGVGIGVVAFGPGTGGDDLSVTVAGNAPGVGDIQVAGPAKVVRQMLDLEETGSQPGGQALAMTVTGPEYQVTDDSEIHSTIPDSAVYYGGSAIVQTSSEMVVASVQNDQLAE